jgi:hypothetical protein
MRLCLLEVQWHWIYQMHLVASFGERGGTNPAAPPTSQVTAGGDGK